MSYLKLTLIFFGLFVAQSTFATDNPIYIGVSAGQTHVTEGINGSYDVATTGTVIAGFTFTDNASFQGSVEANYTRSLKKENVTLNGAANEYKEETLGLFIAARTNSDFYVKAKLGLVDNRITTNTIVTSDAVKVAAGIGFGIKDDSGGITEIEYVVYENDINLLSISYLF